MKSHLPIIALALLVSQTGYAQKIANSSAITESRLRSHLTFIASDALQGRNTPSVGLDTACEYVAAQLSLWGVKPMGENGTYFQTLRLRSAKVLPESSTLSIGGTAGKYQSDFYSTGGKGSASGSAVFVGYGWKVPALKLDPYAGMNCRGKILVVVSGNPTGFGFNERRGDVGKAAKSPEQMAMELGALGVVTLPNTRDQGRFVFQSNGSLAASRSAPVWTPGLFTTPMITLSAEMSVKLMDGESQNLAGILTAADSGNALPSFVMSPSKEVSFKVDQEETWQSARNVVAVIEGTDPKLKAEYVAVGAHIDHVGTGTAGDGIYNGADDDGSGTVSILEIAHAFATGPKPKRSILFVWHMGEERGLWGSRYFTENPTVPINSIICQLNIDMIGRSKPEGDTDARDARLTDTNSVYLIGSNRLSSELAKMAFMTNDRLWKIRYDSYYDRPDDTENLFGRSDHYNYATKGIPILFWFDGIHRDYHQPDDEVDRIDFAKMCRIAQTVYGTAWNVANNPKRPAIDLPITPPAKPGS